MEAEQYKVNFLRFLSKAFPDGLPDGDSYLHLETNSASFDFEFDIDDYIEFKEGSSSKLEDKLTRSDLVFLKKNKIRV